MLQVSKNLLSKKKKKEINKQTNMKKSENEKQTNKIKRMHPE